LACLKLALRKGCSNYLQQLFEKHPTKLFLKLDLNFAEPILPGKILIKSGDCGGAASSLSIASFLMSKAMHLVLLRQFFTDRVAFGKSCQQWRLDLSEISVAFQPWRGDNGTLPHYSWLAMLRAVLLSACALGLLSRSDATLPASPTPNAVVGTGPTQLAAGCDSLSAYSPTKDPKAARIDFEKAYKRYPTRTALGTCLVDTVGGFPTSISQPSLWSTPMFTTEDGVEAINNAAMDLRVVQVRHCIKCIAIPLHSCFRSGRSWRQHRCSVLATHWQHVGAHLCCICINLRAKFSFSGHAYEMTQLRCN
jgi:hypothetical protein